MDTFRIVVISDTHKDFLSLRKIAERHMQNADLFIHLGDLEEDVKKLKALYPNLPVRQVRGNCDFASREADTLEFFALSVKVFATHGHRYYVKSTMDPLLNAAHFSGAQLVLYGHTHIARIEYPAGMTVVNPGSSGLGSEPSFAVIDISDSGGIAARILPMMPKDRYI